MLGENFTYRVKIDERLQIRRSMGSLQLKITGYVCSGLIGKNLFDYIKNREIQDITVVSIFFSRKNLKNFSLSRTVVTVPATEER